MSLRFDFRLDLGHLKTAVDAATPEALAQGMEHIRSVSAPLVPVESGRLVGSATVEVDGDTASLTFEGPYARAQHEHLDWKHEHGQAKFLEQPVLTDADKARAIIAEQIRRAI